MNQAITVTPKTIEAIVKQLMVLTKEVKAIKTRLFEEEPPYGSNAWWEKEIKEAENEFKKGKGIRFESANDAIKWLNS